MKFSILTLFPDFFSSPLQESILKRAIEKQQISVETINIRDFSDNSYKRIDAKPFGGGAGMLMQAEPIAKAIESVKNGEEEYEVIFFTPSAPELTQKDSYELAKNNTHKVFLCGHYEGVDQRVIEKYVDKQFSVGKTVLTGGEIPALLCLDSIVRLLPNVISKEKSHERETFSAELYGKGEYPQFTRPENWRGIEVPKVLLSGNHADIEKYQLENLKNCSTEEIQIIIFREKYKNKKFKLEKNIYVELLPYFIGTDLNILEFKIFTKNTRSIKLVTDVISIDVNILNFENANKQGNQISTDVYFENFIFEKVASLFRLSEK